MVNGGFIAVFTVKSGSFLECFGLIQQLQKTTKKVIVLVKMRLTSSHDAIVCLKKKISKQNRAWFFIFLVTCQNGYDDHIKTETFRVKKGKREIRMGNTCQERVTRRSWPSTY